MLSCFPEVCKHSLQFPHRTVPARPGIFKLFSVHLNSTPCPKVELSFDLGDPCIAVCHPTVLALFSDNFDLQTLDALTSEILESDLVDSTVYMERLEGRSVGRVISPHSLLEVEQRLLERWFHPQVAFFGNLHSK